MVGTGAFTSGFEKRFSFAPANYQYRSMPQYAERVRVAGPHQWNASLTREIKIRERLTFMARLDVLNIPNHGILSGADANPLNSTLGQATSASAVPNWFLQAQGRLQW